MPGQCRRADRLAQAFSLSARFVETRACTWGEGTEYGPAPPVPQFPLEHSQCADTGLAEGFNLGEINQDLAVDFQHIGQLAEILLELFRRFVHKSRGAVELHERHGGGARDIQMAETRQ